MGLFKAISGAVGGTFADQWLDFYTVPQTIAPTAALFHAELRGIDGGRGSNASGSTGVITNGSKILVPEGYGLILLQDGAFTGFTAEPGGYIWDSDESVSDSIFAGDSPSRALIEQSWLRFKFGGRPNSQQIAVFVRLQELPNNKFGTQSEIYWDDAYLNAQVGALARGTYSLKINDPLRFIQNFVPATFTQTNSVLDFSETLNPLSQQLFSEVVSVLASAFSNFSNQSLEPTRMSDLQRRSSDFSREIVNLLEERYEWSATRGLEMFNVTLMAIEYDSLTKELIQTVQRSDALSGGRSLSNMNAAIAAGIESAGASEGGSSAILGLGLAMGPGGVSGLIDREQVDAAQGGDLNKLRELAAALKEGLITPDEYEIAKAKFLDR